MNSQSIPRYATPAPGEAHVWRLKLLAPAKGRAELMQTLSDEERRRAGRYVRARDRDRFVLARGILRSLLGGYLDVDPATLRFAYGDRGKPALADPGQAWLRFNVSHSDHLALVGITTGAEIGVDLERIREQTDVNALAPRALGPGTALLPQCLAAATRRRAFFARWTQQEAYCKALGCGLARVRDAGSPSSSGYSLLDLPLDRGYAAAIAVAGPRPRVVARRWIWPAPGVAQPAGASVASRAEAPRA